MEGVVPSDIEGALQWTVDTVIHFGTDFFAFVILTALVAAFAFYFGRDRIVPLLAGLYAAIPLHQAFPWPDLITTPLLSVALYVLLAALAMLAFSGLASFIASNSFGLIRLTALSALTAGMLIAVSIHVLPVEQLYMFSEPTRALFVSSESFFLWLAAPIVGIFFLGR